MEVNLSGVMSKSLQDSIARVEAKISGIENKISTEKFENIFAQKMGATGSYKQMAVNGLSLNDLKYLASDSSTLYPEVFNYGASGSISKNLIPSGGGIINNAIDGLSGFTEKIVTGIKDSKLFESINSIVEEMSTKHGVDSNLIKAIIKVESNYSPEATSNAGAMGLMQLMPKTAEGLGVLNPYDMYQNIDGGVRLMKTLISSFDNNVKLALAAYNAGSKRVIDAQGVPPIPETQNYVRKVLEIYNPELL
jgi:hypothetical protein